MAAPGSATDRVRVPKYKRLELALRDDIEHERLLPGDRLPAEPELAASHGVARMTARRAIETLVNDGLLTRLPGRGTFVTERRVPYQPATIFSFSRTMAALGMTVETRLIHFDVVPSPPAVARDLGLRDGADVLLVRRARLVNGEPVAIHGSYLAAGLRAALSADDLLRQPISEAVRRAGGAEVTTSRDYLTAEAAVADDAKILEIDPGVPVIRITGCSYSELGHPVMATDAVYRADRFRFALAAREERHPLEPTGFRGPTPG